jgi:hypothetical protein
MGKRKTAQSDAAFSAAITAAGGEVLATTNPYEVMRFRTKHGVGVVYVNAKGARTWNEEALRAQSHLKANEGSLAPVKVFGRRSATAEVPRILERDGLNCFFCGLKLGSDITVEHLVARAHGGPNHISNLFLAHKDCNLRAGHLSAPEKIAIRDTLQRPAPVQAKPKSDSRRPLRLALHEQKPILPSA